MKWTDKNTGLHWWLYYPGKGDKDWWVASGYPAGELEDESYRLPTIDEIKTLFGEESVDGVDCWTSEEYERGDTDAWAVDIDSERVYNHDKSNAKNLLFVSDG